jgi:hypothetical protein
MPIKDFSPREFLKARRPEKFSDSVVEQRPTLNRSMLEYHLDTLTNRSQEIDFERFARRLAQKEICPNLLPHTGPTGGGDSKVDTETYPVADALSLAWFSGVGREAATERWAFAFSATKQWQGKIQSDVAKISATGRKYRKAFFVTNQYVADRFRARMEDKLSKKYKLDVRVLDRSWILDAVFGNKHEVIAIEELRLPVPVNTNVKKGPLDLQKHDALSVVESRIKETCERKNFSSLFVDDCIEAAELARGLELPRSQIDGLFLRAKRAAQEYGNGHQKLVVAYQWAWTLYWWFEDYKQFSELYEEVEKYAVGSEIVDDLELLSNLWYGLQSSVRRGHFDINDAKLDARTGVLLAELDRLKQDQNRPSAALQAEAMRLLADLMSCPPSKTDPLLNGLQKVIQRCGGLIGFPLETLVQILIELGDYLGDRPAFNQLHETIVEIVFKRKGEVSAAQMLLKRGAQQLDANKPYEAIRSLGRTLGWLYKDESRSEMIRALYLCGNAYERIGLRWAARGVVLIAASLATQGLQSPSDISPVHAACYDKLRWLELQIGRLPQALEWHELYSVIKNSLAIQGYDLKKYDSYEINFDVIAGILMLKTDLWQLKHLSRLPDTLDRLNLPMSADALRFALGYEDNLPDEVFPKETRQSDIQDFFSKWRDQPAADDLPSTPSLYEGQKVFLNSIILGCKVTVESENSSPCIDLSESVLAALESVLATTIQDRLIAREPVLSIKVRKSDFAQTPFEFELKDREGRPHMEISCAAFNPHSMSFELQGQVKEQLRDLMIHIIARICLVEDMEKTVKKLFKDEHALERAINYSNSFIVLGNVLGHTPKTNIDAWINSKAQNYPQKRNEVWDAADRLAKQMTKKEKPSSKSPAGTDEAPKGLFEMEDAKHTDMQIISLIRESLWEKVNWSGTGFFQSLDDSEPPILGLLVKNAEAAREIFTCWRKEIGKIDSDEKLRLTIIRGISKSNPYSYRFVVTANPHFGSTPPKGKFKYFGMIARSNTMTPTSDSNLNRFLNGYRKFNAYCLTYAVFQDDDSEPELDMKNFIGKRELNIREAWEIGRHDIDMVGIREEDDPIIPSGKDDAPVVELLQWKRRNNT